MKARKKVRRSGVDLEMIRFFISGGFDGDGEWRYYVYIKGVIMTID